MKSKKVLSLLLATTMVFGGMLTGCKNNDKDAKNDGEKPAVAQNSEKDDKDSGKEADTGIDKEQYITIPVVSEPRTLDSCIATDVASNRVLTHMIEGLTRITQEDGKDKIVPGIAESWDSSEDGLTWTFHLRDAKWADGVPVTSNDFLYAIRRTMDPETASTYSFILYPLKNATKVAAGEVGVEELGVTAVDDKTLKFELDYPAPYFLDLTYFKVMMPQRQDMVEKYGDTFGSEADQFISNGAFNLVTWQHDNEFIFEKNDNYWDAENIKLDKITFKIIKDESAKMNAMLSGMVDLGGVSQPDYMKMFDETGDFDYLATVQPSVVYDYYNQTSRYFKNVNIRKAFQIALDRVELNKVYYRERRIPAFAWVPPTVQINGEDFRTKCGVEPMKKVIDNAGNPKELLIKGLKELGESENPADMTVTMLTSGTSDRDREWADYYVQKLQGALGINVEVDAYEWAIFQDKCDNLEYEFATAAWIGDYNDPNTFLEMFMSDAGIVPTGWNNPEYDKLIKDAGRETDPEKRFQMFKRAEEILLVEDAVINPLVIDKSSTYQKKFVKGVARPLFGTLDLTRAYTQGRK